MKSFVPIILLSACTYTTHAVPLQHKNKTSAKNPHKALVHVLLQKQTNAANKTTALKKRLIANAYTTGGSVLDSNHYYYSNGRGSANTTADSYFDNYYSTAINPVQNIRSDSSVNWHDFSSGAGLVRSDTKVYTYNTNGSIGKVKHFSQWQQAEFAHTYNSNGLVTTITSSDTMNGTAMIPKRSMYISYNSQNLRTYDSTHDIINNVPLSKRIYTYNANGNMLSFLSYQYIAGSWLLTYTNTNVYDGSNRLITTEAAYDMGSGLENMDKDSFSYQGSSVNHEFHVDYTWDAGLSSWTAEEMIHNQYNSAGLVDTYYIYQYTTQWDTMERDVYTYDANGLLLRSNGYLYNGNGNYATVPYDQSTMYYEDYDPLTIQKLNDKSLLTLYPNPANNILFVQTSILNGNINITNMKGQNVHSEQLSGQQQVINTQQLPSGNYILTIFNKDKTQTAYQQFIKQ